jgi:hypothetical protein
MKTESQWGLTPCFSVVSPHRNAKSPVWSHRTTGSVRPTTLLSISPGIARHTESRQANPQFGRSNSEVTCASPAIAPRDFRSRPPVGRRRPFGLHLVRTTRRPVTVMINHRPDASIAAVLQRYLCGRRGPGQRRVSGTRPIAAPLAPPHLALPTIPARRRPGHPGGQKRDETGRC